MNMFAALLPPPGLSSLTSTHAHLGRAHLNLRTSRAAPVYDGISYIGPTRSWFIDQWFLNTEERTFFSLLSFSLCSALTKQTSKEMNWLIRTHTWTRPRFTSLWISTVTEAEVLLFLCLTLLPALRGRYLLGFLKASSALLCRMSRTMLACTISVIPSFPLTLSPLRVNHCVEGALPKTLAASSPTSAAAMVHFLSQSNSILLCLCMLCWGSLLPPATFPTLHLKKKKKILLIGNLLYFPRRGGHYLPLLQKHPSTPCLWLKNSLFDALS